MQLLMLSSSRAGQGGFLDSARQDIGTHFSHCDKLLFIPFAGVTLSWDDYTAKVQTALPQWEITGLHQVADPAQAITSAQGIIVGGGNTFYLLQQLYQQQLFTPLRQAVKQGLPYLGWSAGANICGNSIRTTNDMPIVMPPSFDALQWVPFQLNPHYSDYQPPGHNGETRAQRLAEFCQLNPQMPVIGLREGSGLLRNNNKLTLLGELDGVQFTGDKQSCLTAGCDLSYLL